MGNEFMETLDGATRLVRGIATFIVIAVWVVMTAGPYIIYRNVADFLTCAITRDRVWIVEKNHAIFAGMIPSPFPMIDGHGKNCPVQRYYACVRSVREGESSSWLGAAGIQPPRRRINTVTKVDLFSPMLLFSMVHLMHLGGGQGNGGNRPERRARA
ncbi:MAG: hypothetical protein ABSF26_09135 [Thermoguttaceae bacterium]|jgi:hypothetical protein